ncbi:hypothetical protein CBL_03461 [Carabus blaptoides fortunei]
MAKFSVPQNTFETITTLPDTTLIFDLITSDSCVGIKSRPQDGGGRGAPPSQYNQSGRSIAAYAFLWKSTAASCVTVLAAIATEGRKTCYLIPNRQCGLKLRTRKEHQDMVEEMVVGGESTLIARFNNNLTPGSASDEPRFDKYPTAERADQLESCDAVLAMWRRLGAKDEGGQHGGTVWKRVHDVYYLVRG